MKVKIDTKEKFHVVTPQEASLSATLTEELRNLLLGLLEKEVKNVVFNAGSFKTIDETAADALADFQQSFYENNASFVICELQPAVQTSLEEVEILELLNVTPSESEAWDIIQMEEIERELLGDEE